MIENLNQLVVFDAVARAGSVTRGAEQLMVSQPVVSKHLNNLQRKLNSKLIERRGRGIRLTEAGVVVATLARRIVSIAADVDRALADLDSLRSGQLRIGASTTISVYMLPELLVRFRRKFPGIRLGVETENSEILAARMLAGEIDVGLAEAPIESPGIDCVAFMHDQLVPIVSPQHPFARQRRISKAAFFREPLIAREAGHRAFNLIQQAISQSGIVIKPSLSLASTEAVKRAVSAGLGVALVSRLSISMETAARKLVELSVSGLHIQRPLYRAISRERPESKAMHAFLCLLKHVGRGTLPPLGHRAK